MEQSITSLVEILHKVHCDNSTQEYYAVRQGAHRISTMPLTPFVYEFFLFNSIYQIDWTQSYNNNKIIYNSNDEAEFTKQKQLIQYLKDYAKNKPGILHRAFEPLLYITDLDGEWIHINEDLRITKEDGDKFFARIKELQRLIQVSYESDKISGIKRIFEIIKEATNYIYLIRNNIFHGAKNLGDIYDRSQKRRIEVYEIFLKCITSLFFLSTGKEKVASDFIPCIITSNSLGLATDEAIFSIETSLDCINRRLMKIGDSRLIIHFTRQLPPPNVSPTPKSALFYPSAGRDIITPLLLGLPYCTQFYFYECGQRQRQPPVLNVLKQLPTIQFEDRSRFPRWKESGDTHYIDLEFNGIARRIYWVHSDNIEFLNSDVELAFYFHRGDSWGEGGAGQKWDSALLPRLKNMIPNGKKCVFLTDGEPGGLSKEQFVSFNKLSIPFIERDREYYYGVLADNSL